MSGHEGNEDVAEGCRMKLEPKPEWEPLEETVPKDLFKTE